MKMTKEFFNPIKFELLDADKFKLSDVSKEIMERYVRQKTERFYKEIEDGLAKGITTFTDLFTGNTIKFDVKEDYEKGLRKIYEMLYGKIDYGWTCKHCGENFSGTHVSLYEAHRKYCKGDEVTDVKD